MCMFGKGFQFAQDATLVLTLGFRPKDRVYISPENTVSSSNFHDEAFKLTLVSDGNKKMFPQNKASLFSTTLHNRLSLGQEWEVALLKMEYAQLWTNITSSLKMVYILSFPLDAALENEAGYDMSSFQNRTATLMQNQKSHQQ